jgi:hypothetical protein
MLHQGNNASGKFQCHKPVKCGAAELGCFASRRYSDCGVEKMKRALRRVHWSKEAYPRCAGEVRPRTGGEISALLLSVSAKKPKSTATWLAWDDGGLIMHFIMSALAFSFLFALLFGLI